MHIGTSLYKYGNGKERAKIHLVAAEGKAITKDGIELWNCVDVESADGWFEVELPDTED